VQVQFRPALLAIAQPHELVLLIATVAVLLVIGAALLLD